MLLWCWHTEEGFKVHLESWIRAATDRRAVLRRGMDRSLRWMGICQLRAQILGI